jgi:hypothetical protein
MATYYFHCHGPDGAQLVDAHGIKLEHPTMGDLIAIAERTARDTMKVGADGENWSGWSCDVVCNGHALTGVEFASIRIDPTPKEEAAMGPRPATERAIECLGTITDLEERAHIMSELKLHPSLTEDRIIDACERQMMTLDNPGFCNACGADADGCEPDAREYPCEICGENAVYGAQELLLHL